jgi:hypothetical protein
LRRGVEYADIHDETVWHSHPYVELCIDARGDGALYIAARVVEQHFVVSNVNADWRQSAQIP